MLISKRLRQVFRRLTFLSSAALGVALAAACGDGTSEPANRAPRAVGSIPVLELLDGETGAQDVTEYFSDPDGDTLSYRVESSAIWIATARVSGSGIRVTAVAIGTAVVTVTASDPDGLTATQSFEVTVSFRDDFDSSHSLGDWAVGISVETEVAEGTLRLTQVRNFLGTFWHDLDRTLESGWEATARMGSADGKAWPSLWSSTGDPRYIAYSLDIGVLRQGRDTFNYLLRVFDEERGWLIVESGRSSAINTGVGEFTEVTLTFEGGTYRARAGGTLLFEVDVLDWMPTEIDMVGLGVDWGRVGNSVVVDWVAMRVL